MTQAVNERTILIGVGMSGMPEMMLGCAAMCCCYDVVFWVELNGGCSETAGTVFLLRHFVLARCCCCGSSTQVEILLFVQWDFFLVCCVFLRLRRFHQGCWVRRRTLCTRPRPRSLLITAGAPREQCSPCWKTGRYRSSLVMWGVALMVSSNDFTVAPFS